MRLGGGWCLGAVWFFVWLDPPSYLVILSSFLSNDLGANGQAQGFESWLIFDDVVSWELLTGALAFFDDVFLVSRGGIRFPETKCNDE